MENNWAAEQLQVIRTLMERSAVYRRALAPIMTFVGVAGMVAGLAGWRLGLADARGVVGFWMGVGVVAALGALLLVRRQALKAAEPFWSPPTRRVARALCPPYAAGLAISGILWALPSAGLVAPGMLPALWLMLHGCGLHSAGFFMARGIRRLGWFFLVLGCLLAAIAAGWPGLAPVHVHAVMGLTFGGLHLAYGAYLYFTEKDGKAV